MAEHAEGSEIRLVAIIGSLRAESFNRLVFDAAVELADPSVALVEVSLRDVPLYNGDVEAAGDPPAVVDLKAAVSAADGLVIFTPEYNRSIPAVTKNAVDWLSSSSRGTNLLSEAVVGIVAATPGRHDADGVRGHLSASVGSNTRSLYEPTLGLASISRRITDGRLTDQEARDKLGRWLAGFAAYAEQERTT